MDATPLSRFMNTFVPRYFEFEPLLALFMERWQAFVALALRLFHSGVAAFSFIYWVLKLFSQLCPALLFGVESC